MPPPVPRSPAIWAYVKPTWTPSAALVRANMSADAGALSLASPAKFRSPSLLPFTAQPSPDEIDGGDDGVVPTYKAFDHAGTCQLPAPMEAR